MFLGDHIRLGNPEGKTGVLLEAAKDGSLRLDDPTGEAGVLLRASQHGGAVGVYNQTGKLGVALSAVKEGGFVSIHNPQGVSAVTITQDSVVPENNDWKAFKLTARLNTGGWALAQKLNQVSFTVVPSVVDRLKLEAQVNTTCQPSWNFYLGQGRFSVSDREVRAAYEEAGNYVFEEYIQPVFSQVSKNEVKITFFIQSYEVGTWRNGVMKLKGE
ncbi:MAG: hypothetical protein HPY71_14690 [Firmicutes bacterium]|nr:hypothetical protein [Bacillota bacterium]